MEKLSDVGIVNLLSALADGKSKEELSAAIGQMYGKANFRKTMLQEELSITHALMAVGYYPYTIKLDTKGWVEILARPACLQDEESIAEKAGKIIQITAGEKSEQ